MYGNRNRIRRLGQSDPWMGPHQEGQDPWDKPPGTVVDENFSKPAPGTEPGTGNSPSDYGWTSQNTSQLLNLLGAAGLTAMKVWATNAAAGRATGPLNQQKWFTAEMQKKVQQNAALQQQLSALMAANAKAQQAQQGVPVWVWVIGGVMGAALVGGAVYLIAKK